MDTLRWQQVKTLFEQVVELPADERAGYLHAYCADDLALRHEVEGLLASDDSAVGFLETPAMLDGVLQPAPSLAGTHIGPYLLVRQIGRGGMGSVYLAERTDKGFQQRFALKIIRRGLDTDDILSRFHYERQILASLDHPHIARLFDGGTTEDGRPYFVMEYVEGMPITTYCDHHRLSTRQRLALFRTVCRAVQYAHANLVIHRDLKPSNILVTEDPGSGPGQAPQVKLLDFGIAKLLADEATAAQGPTAPQTRTGLRMMTPEYAAPEQIKGEAVTTATDVYQLGVLLYELLTGHRPYRLASRVQHEIERVILEEEPTRPSAAVGQTEVVQDDETTAAITPEEISKARATEPGTLRRRLAGDLDTIVLAALKKEPARRYASVEALSEDLRRHLGGLPVAARPDTFGYRVEKFVQRHRMGVVAAALVMVAVFGGAGVAVWQAGIAAQERDRAQAEAAKAEQINAFLQGMFASANPVEQGRDVKVADVLDAAAAQVGRELAAQPEIEAAVRRTLGITYQDIGLYNEAEQQLSRALALRRKHLGSEHPETAQSLKDYALVRHWQGDLDTAAVYYQAALARFRYLDEPTIGYAESLNDYGLLRMDQADYQTADSLFRAALQMYRGVAPDRIETASTLNNLGLARHWLGDVEAADTLYHQALNRFEQRASDFITIAQTLNNLAWVYLDRNDFHTADSLFRASLALRHKHLGNAHPDVALALNNLAMLVYMPQGNYQAADSLLQEALIINRQAVPGDHPYTSNVLHSLGLVRMAQARLDEAETYFRASLAMRQQLYQGAEAHPVIAATRVELGECLVAQHRYAEAETLLLEGLAGLEASGDGRASEARQRLADLYKAWGKPEQAAAYRTSSSIE